MNKNTIENNLKELCQRTEDRMVQQALGTLVYAADAQRLLHELQVHQIKLEMQNAALRKAQLELEVQHNHYVDLYAFASLGCLSLTLDGLIQEPTSPLPSGWGWVARGQLLNRDFVSCVAPRDQDRWSIFLRRMVLAR